MGLINSKIVKFLNSAEAKSLKNDSKSKFWTSSDLQATAVMIWPLLSKKSLITNVTPVIDGAARGAILVDYTKESGKPKNVEIIQQIDAKELQRKILFHFL